jgi:hypothetical protein
VLSRRPDFFSGLLCPCSARSLFQPHTEIIRKRRLAKTTEFERLVKIQEAEARTAHFPGAGQLAVVDGGLASTNKRAAPARVVRHVVL